MIKQEKLCLTSITGKLLRGAALATVMIVTGTAAYAQAVPDAQVGIASPGRVQQQMPQAILEQPAISPVEVRQAAPEGAPAGSENIKFTLQSVQLDGVTVYTEKQLAALYADRIGQTVSLADIYGIAARMTMKFRNDGYILTQVIIPPQTIESGTVRLQVVEGYIDGVNVNLENGAPKESEAAMAQIRSYAARITNGRALNVKDLERYMLLINDLPGVSARGVLSPSTSQTGAADLNILVLRDPFEAVAGIDNYGTRFLGPLQLSGAASGNSLFGYNERLTGQVVVAPDKGRPLELAYFAGGYVQPLGDSGLKLNINTSYTDTEPGHTLDEFDVKGKSTFLGIGVSYPVIRSRATSLYTSLGMDMRNVDTRNNVEDTRHDRIRAVRGNARLEHLDTLFGAGLNVVDVEIAQGLDMLGASGKESLDKSRPDGDPTFTKLNIELQRLQRLTNQFNLLVAVRGQLSNNALMSSEEFGVGGMGYGRGFDPSEIIGDEGFAAKVEVQWNIPGEFGPTHHNQFFTFLDGGRVFNDDAISNDQITDTATSVGFGIRSKVLDYTSVDFTVAKPLNRDVQAMEDNDPRFFLSVTQRF